MHGMDLIIHKEGPDVSAEAQKFLFCLINESRI